MDNQEVSKIAKNLEAGPGSWTNTSYKWFTKTNLNDMIMMSEDLEELSIYGAGEAVIKSHVFSALGATLFDGENMVVWVEYPLEKIKNHHGTVKKDSSRIYWEGGIKLREYGYLETNNKFLGLSTHLLFNFISYVGEL